MELTFKRVSDFSFQEALSLWNKGFEGYATPINMTMDMYLQRMTQEGLSPELSLIALSQDEPIGFVMNAFRTIGGRRIAWNGGTGIIPTARAKGVGRQLMEACLQLYREQGVDLACLEAIATNEPAIALYQRVGYSVIDRLQILQQTGPLLDMPTSQPRLDWVIQRGLAQDVRAIPFYPPLVPWQTHWASVQNGESLILTRSNGDCIGYLVYKRNWDSTGTLQSIVIFQCEVNPAFDAASEVVQCLLSDLFESTASLHIRRAVMNLSASNKIVVEALEQIGLSRQIEQVFMSCNL